MWWLFSLVPVILLPFFNCLATKKPEKAKKTVTIIEADTATDKSSDSSSGDESAKKRTRKSSLRQKRSGRGGKSQKRVCFQDEVMAKGKISSSAKADAAIRADQKAAEMATARAATAPTTTAPTTTVPTAAVTVSTATAKTATAPAATAPAATAPTATATAPTTTVPTAAVTVSAAKTTTASTETVSTATAPTATTTAKRATVSTATAPAATTPTVTAPKATAKTATAPPQRFSSKDIYIEPGEIEMAACGGLYSFDLFNESSQPLAYEVKCSDNDVYRVQPVDGVAKARGSTRIEVLRQNGAAKPDKLVVVVAGPAGETLMAVVDLLVVEDEDEE